jgi:predicted dinucleotide-binding enzyme
MNSIFNHFGNETQKFNVSYVSLDHLPALRTFVKENGGTIKHIPIRNNMNAVRADVMFSAISWAALAPTLKKFREFCQEHYINL